MKYRILILTAAAAAMSIAAAPKPENVSMPATNLPDVTVVAERAAENGVTCAMSAASQYGDIPDLIVIASRSTTSVAPVTHRTQGGDVPDIVVTAQRPDATAVAAGELSGTTNL